MARRQFTKAQKDEHFSKLRAQWRAAKAKAESGDYDAVFAEAARMGVHKVSHTAFMLVYSQMQSQKLEGLPYVHAKTFHAWIHSGYRVKKGEHSTLEGITFVSTNKDDDDAVGYIFPKVYHLFHSSQVEKVE